MKTPLNMREMRFEKNVTHSRTGLMSAELRPAHGAALIRRLRGLRYARPWTNRLWRFRPLSPLFRRPRIQDTCYPAEDDIRQPRRQDRRQVSLGGKGHAKLIHHDEKRR